MLHRAGLRTLPARLARPQAQVGKRFASSAPKKMEQGGFAEFGPFLKRVPVDVYPLLGAVSFACGLGVYYGVRMFWVDHTLRLKRSSA